MLEPTLHKPVPLGTRVKIPSVYHREEGEFWGRVAGIASAHVVFRYIVILDRAIESSFGLQEAVVVGGGELEGEGGAHWRIENPRQENQDGDEA